MTSSGWFALGLLLCALALWSHYRAYRERRALQERAGEPYEARQAPVATVIEPRADDDFDPELEYRRLKRRLDALEGDIEARLAAMDGRIGNVIKRDKVDAKRELEQLTAQALAAAREPSPDIHPGRTRIVPARRA